LPSATDELDAIVEATASATNRIMDAADVIMEIVSHIPKDHADKITDAVTSIYESCTFQDITGQRVTKIVNVLKVVEQRLQKMVDAVSGDGAAPASAAAAIEVTQSDIDALFPDEAAVRAAKDASLLNGPAAPGEEKTQAEIDAIFSAGN
jgi:chemotaxis protein CheZ